MKKYEREEKNKRIFSRSFSSRFCQKKHKVRMNLFVSDRINMSLVSVYEESSLLRVFFAVCVRILTQINKMYCRLIW